MLNLKGTVEYFVENTFNYPTLAEAYKIAGLDAWNRMGELQGRALWGGPHQMQPTPKTCAALVPSVIF
ncbi:unnamed protein product [Ciceribacter selenitireducens ATCC BAA-1503]|uniref:Pyridine nucleotide-disulphide oxidoreductase dimerisation domain-containing protein n=1 Tax=Ciceribacter selenitireducens ATCC BAA-1503 TaxID=1336235 RepID=A0A376AIG6_9HYPH|nr:unnamed protein product [Ciceribacter selenitireducens ATCC BAA-1503]